MTCGNHGVILGCALTLRWVTSLFLGLSLCNQSIGLSTGVGTCTICQSSSLIFPRLHIQCCHLLQLEVAVVEPCLELCLELQVQVGRHGKLDVLLSVGLEVREWTMHVLLGR